MSLRINVAAISFATLAHHGALLIDMLRARKRVFVDAKGWALPTALDMEFDQYDTPISRWIVAHAGGAVLAGVRLTPTTAQVGSVTYMLKDAQEGRIDGLPSQLLDHPAPVCPYTWEGSRVFVDPHCAAHLRTPARDAMVHAMLEDAVAQGARQIICILPETWPDLARRHALSMRAAGPVFIVDGHASQAVILSLPDLPTPAPVFTHLAEAIQGGRRGLSATPA